MRKWKAGLVLLAFATLCGAAQPIIENERVTVWDVTWNSSEAAPVPHHAHEFVTVYLAGANDGSQKKGDVVVAKSGDTKLKPGERAVIIELKDHAVAPLVNNSGYPNAFPRPRSEKVTEDDRVIVWRYAFRPGEPSPMHFHDKDAIPIYMEETDLKSTTPDGQVTENDYKPFEVRFSPRNRTHTEVLVRGTGSAIITELK
ncbi:MAG TPA: hypothetical protein VEF06_00490 [Bryobacteraceae bacterium]|nr:hypothetical protein [Bryobacteraceae bacterium]